MTVLLVLLVACGTTETPPSETAIAHEAPPEPAPAAATTAPEPAAAAVIARLNLNTATTEQLATVPGAGGKMVHEFEEYRPYVSISQFRKEMGKYVDAEKIAGYEQYLYVPIDPAASDAATLLQLPGLDAAEAEKLIAGRPYADRKAFLDALAPLVSPAELEAGQGWVAGK